MHLKKQIQINAFTFIIVLSMIPISGISGGNEENAIKLFKSNHFEEALPIFEDLLKLYPNDTTLSYYTGVCLTETNLFGDRTRNLLKLAAQSNVPANVNYYIGKNYHALNFFEPALIYYNRFKDYSKQSEQKKIGLNEKISMCSNRINPFINSNSSADIIGNKDSIALPVVLQNRLEKTGEKMNDSLITVLIVDSTQLIVKPFEIPPFLNDDSLINFNLTSDIYYTKLDQFKTTKGKQSFVEGWKNSEVLKKLISETDSLRNEYAKTKLTEIRTEISSRVIKLEYQTITTKSATDFNYMKAGEYELAYWNQAPECERMQLVAENDSIKSLTEKKVLIEMVERIDSETIAIDTNMIDSTKIQADIPVDEPAKTGIIIFKVQIGAYNTELPESAKKLYKKISMLRTINQFTDDRNYTIYTIGELSNIKDAVKLQEQIRQESVKDAFVIAFKDGKRIPLNEALESTK